MNQTMLQAFEYTCPDDGNHFDYLKEQAEMLIDAGITSLWLPPVFKGSSERDTGYSTYDLYDLGEFDQKGTIRTKYGTKEQLHALIEHLHGLGMKVYADVVLNHKASGDEEETFLAQPVQQDNRLENAGEEREITAWTKFTFPGRGDTYSSFKWNHHHFTGVDYDSATGEEGVFLIKGENKGWETGVAPEKGNFDYLMFCDVHLSHPEVREELFHWAQWFIEETGVDGFRFDALKHISDDFIHDLVNHIKSFREDFYFFGEYWVSDGDQTEDYLYQTKYKTDLFDVNLHYHLQQASLHHDYDMRTIFDNTLVQAYPQMAVTFVDNHDSQPGEALESFVEPDFKKIAYALILLRRDGYPCVFFGDYFGLGEPRPMEPKKDLIDNLLYLRKTFAYGDQEDYFHEPHLIGWVRQGEEHHPEKLAVIISTKEGGSIRMSVGPEEAGKVYRDYTGSIQDTITIDDEGYGDFMVGDRDVSCWAVEGK